MAVKEAAEEVIPGAPEVISESNTYRKRYCAPSNVNTRISALPAACINKKSRLPDSLNVRRTADGIFCSEYQRVSGSSYSTPKVSTVTDEIT